MNQTWIQENALTDRTRIVETETTERIRIVEKTKRLGHWLEFFSRLGAGSLVIVLCSPLFFLLWSYQKSKEITITGDDSLAQVEFEDQDEDWADCSAQEEFEENG